MSDSGDYLGPRPADPLGIYEYVVWVLVCGTAFVSVVLALRHADAPAFPAALVGAFVGAFAMEFRRRLLD